MQGSVSIDIDKFQGFLDTQSLCLGASKNGMSGREAWSPRRPPGLKLWRYAAHDMSIEASRLLEARGSAYRAALTLLPGHRDESAATLQVSTSVLRIGSKACEVSASMVQDDSHTRLPSGAA